MYYCRSCHTPRPNYPLAHTVTSHRSEGGIEETQVHLCRPVSELSVGSIGEVKGTDCPPPCIVNAN